MKIIKNLFGKTKEPVAISVSTLSEDQRLIEEIHNEFDTAPDRILKQALEILNLESEKKVELQSNVVEKAIRLKNQGFIKNGLVANLKKTEEEISHKDFIIGMNKNMADMVNYYASTYPFLKFLPESELDRICEKYGLIYAPVKHYKMPVPDKNLEEIENAQKLRSQDEIDKMITYRLTDESNTIMGLTREEERLVRKEGIPVHPDVIKNGKSSTFSLTTSRYNQRSIIEKHFGKKISIRWEWAGSSEFSEIDKSGLFIAAPKKHFDLTDLEFDGKKGYFKKTTTIVVKDPIVFRYVKGGIQVLSKWGLEAEDPALQHEILN
jgi:hypothetical protein